MSQTTGSTSTRDRSLPDALSFWVLSRWQRETARASRAGGFGPAVLSASRPRSSCTALEFTATFRTLLQVRLEALPLARVQRAQRVEHHVFRELFVRIHERSPCSDRRLRSCNNALRMRVFTVPSGSPVLAAISEWVIPSKNAISIQRRCSGNISVIADTYFFNHGVALCLFAQVMTGSNDDVFKIRLRTPLSQNIDRAMPGDHPEPSRQIPPAAVKRCGLSPQLHEDLLEHIFRCCCVGQNSQSRGVHDR